MEYPLSDKIKTTGNITLLEGDYRSPILNDYFVNITAGLEIAEIGQNLTRTNKSCDPVDVTIDMYKSLCKITGLGQESQA